MTLQQIKERYRELIIMKGHPAKAQAVLCEELLTHYSSPKGRQELMRTPHASKSPVEAVALLMEDVRRWKIDG